MSGFYNQVVTFLNERGVDEDKEAGYGSVVWDGRDKAARDVASGIYLDRLEVEGSVETRKALLVR